MYWANCLLFPLLAILAFSACDRAAAEQPASQANELLVFDLPSQDLNQALKSYAAFTGLQLLYQTSIAEGRRSSPVQGSFTPEAALQALLADSGLVGRRTDIDAITIAPAPTVSDAAAAPDGQFLGILQTAVLRGLCRNEGTRLGNYRAAFQLWITEAGAIRRATLLDSTGDASRDKAIVRTLESVTLGSVPPGIAAKPVTMTIIPRPSRRGAECLD